MPLSSFSLSENARLSLWKKGPGKEGSIAGFSEAGGVFPGQIHLLEPIASAITPPSLTQSLAREAHGLCGLSGDTVMDLEV